MRPDEPIGDGPASRRNPLDWPRHAGAATEVLAAVRGELRRKRARRRCWAGGGLAVFAVGAFVAAVAWRVPAPPPHDDGSRPSLIVVQPRQQALPDGSRVDLAEGARIGFDFSGAERRVTLLDGEAFFAVAPDAAHPFIVSASGVKVRAVGTAFSVRLGSRDVDVVVTHGRVAVAGPENAESGHPANVAYVDRDQRAVVSLASGAVPSVSAVGEELNARLAWRMPRLELDETPLADVIAAFNRQPGAKPLRLADPDLGRLPLSGVLRADNTDVLLDLLKSSYGIEASADGGALVLTRRLSRR